MNVEVPTPPPAGFGLRLLALVVDMLVLAMICYGLRLVLGDRVHALGDWGRLIGLVIGVVYLGAMHSEWFDGQTIGKLAAGLRVSRLDGSFLTPPQATARALLLLVPAALNGLNVDLTVLQGWLPGLLFYVVSGVIGVAILVAVFGGVFSTALLVLIDSPWRRGLHDLIAGTVVVRTTPRGRPAVTPLSRVRLWSAVAIPVVLVAALAAWLVVLSVKSSPLGEALEELGKVQATVLEHRPGASVGVNLNLANTSGKPPVLVVTVWTVADDLQAVADEVAQLVLHRHPDLVGADQVRVVARSGYTLLFLSVTESRTATMPRAD